MRHSDNTRHNASVAGRGLGAGLVTLLAALGRQADDVARFAGRYADDLGRGAFQQADDISRVAVCGGDDLLRGADDAVKPWALSEPPAIEPQSVVATRHVADTVGGCGRDVMWHLAKETGKETLELAIEFEMENE
jgi:hypothetical protein